MTGRAAVRPEGPKLAATTLRTVMTAGLVLLVLLSGIVESYD